MSNAIRYDSLLVHYLARELDDRLAGRRLRAVRFDPDHRRLILHADDELLVWELHPEEGFIRVVRDGEAGMDSASRDLLDRWAGRDVRIQRRARVRAVEAPRDERFLEIEIDAAGEDRASRLVVELMGNQWNAIALSPSRQILAVLWPREAGDRLLRVGASYVPPSTGTTPRDGRDSPLPFDEWRALLGDEEPEGRRRALIRRVAWTSPLNALPVLGDAAAAPDPAALRSAWERYRDLATLPEPRPRLLDLDRPTAYPVELPGVQGHPATALIAALEAAAGAGRTHAAGSLLPPEVRDAIEARRDRVAARARRLREEAEAAPERATKLRRQADLLMSQLHAVRKGSTAAELDDFEGGVVRVELDPTLSAVENAEALYTRAKKRERAAERLPARVRKAVAERNRLDRLLEAVDRGEADEEEVARWVREARSAVGGGGDDEERLPYHRFTSSGGLEIRVGRSGRANDALTFHHSSPDDIWLHARDVAGAHVILRWQDREQNPPKRDLVEAAVLAALNSRARTSGTVPVDWTRRKYVRKPRKAAPGAVLPDRVSTVFVEPDPGLPERLRR